MTSPCPVLGSDNSQTYGKAPHIGNEKDTFKGNKEAAADFTPIPCCSFCAQNGCTSGLTYLTLSFCQFLFP